MAELRKMIKKGLGTKITKPIAKPEKETESDEDDGTGSSFNPSVPNWDHVISTGCTLMDLAATGGRLWEGGIPTGILVEIAGESGSGKTAVLVETAANVQEKGGAVRYADPEARLDLPYAELTGMSIEESEDYSKPDTVAELFKYMSDWDTDPSVPNFFAGDSLAALSTDLEMDNDEGDKMGMKRAKEFSEALRKHCRKFHPRNILMMCSNQLRESQGKKVAPGGKAIGFYASLRYFCSPKFPSDKITKTKTINGVKHEKVIGVVTTVTVRKNSLDDPWRKFDLYVVFGYGIDDIRGNLSYLKECSGSKKYVLGGKEIATSIDKAIEYVETNNLQNKLKEEVRTVWHDIEKEFKTVRAKKRG